MPRRPPPLPNRDGVAPSFLWLPRESWPDLITFLVQRFPHMDESILRGRLERGELVDETGQRLAAQSPFQPGSRIWYYREVREETPVPFEEVVLHRDERLLVVDKPHFLSIIPAGRHLKETLLTRLRLKLDLPDLTPCHRLDRETAGVVMFCLHAPSRGAYQKLFEARAVQKTYEAIAPYRAGLDLPLVHRSRLEEGEGFFTMQEVAGEPNSETRISLMERRGDWARYQLEPHTGKKHQLRAHLTALGIPIQNDPWYPTLQTEKGDDFSQPLQLLARRIEFLDPFSGTLRSFSSQRQLAW
ncbi:pseudouridine synthase [Chitinimonas sp. BJB300]|uniref:pseudouridine synthase n=1 Tax=Chitinimonas sp. BJB300 TaxID=1559339 RepID=UPI000C0D5B38|nr:pseudouridine synthase [Chitinimonas sp. BJB300]PHV13266.1 pseudouridine synthase [Chitinimonas sp. BJB300]TSJ89646.1 pseudouridine synthase [Chitinimonas sp. BJB300]